MKTYPQKIEIHNGKTATLSNNQLLVKYQKSIDSETKSAFLKQFSLTISSPPKESQTKYNESNLHFFCESKSEIDFKKLDESLSKNKNSEIEYFSPVYKINEKDINTWFSVNPNALVIGMNGEALFSEADKILRKYKCLINEQKTRFLNGFLYIELESTNENSVFEVKASLIKQERGWISEINYELIPLVSPTCHIIPNDTLFPIQWNLGKIEWEPLFLKCVGQSTVAIIDEGCDLNHPDLSFTSQGLNLSTMLPTGSSTGNHGTACAGIAAGVANNAIGVAGVAGKAKILPLAVQMWTDIEIANGINYATKFGANVVSMSFGVYDSWGIWNYNVINPAIVYSHKQGVFLCAATGNENSSTNNRYPSKHPLVVAVGGSNKDDKRKSVGDAIEGFWGACYGIEQFQSSWTGVSVVAPCVHIPTTDRLGAAGYSGGDYHNTFNGTSAATPHVAGLAALLKAKYPILTNIDIKKIIEMSADKISTYIYSYDVRFPNSTWTQEVGHGRINVKKALDLASRLLSCCNQHDTCCSKL